MASTKLAIHIPPEANPENVAQLVKFLAEATDQVFPTVRDLLDLADSSGINSRTEIQAIAYYLRLLARSAEGVSLSTSGRVFARLKDDVKGDILHFLFYTGWDEAVPSEFLPAWTYQVLCNRLWASHSVQLDSAYLNQCVEETINEAEQSFEALGIQDFAGVSFSLKSLSGFRKWLEELKPPVMERDVFSRRAFCPPELLLLALGYVLRNEDSVTETDVLLSREKREAMSRMCLLDPNGFDRALDWMIPIFPEVISPGTTAGFYGRFVRLHKIPTLKDIIR